MDITCFKKKRDYSFTDYQYELLHYLSCCCSIFLKFIFDLKINYCCISCNFVSLLADLNYVSISFIRKIMLILLFVGKMRPAFFHARGRASLLWFLTIWLFSMQNIGHRFWSFSNYSSSQKKEHDYPEWFYLNKSLHSENYLVAQRLMKICVPTDMVAFIGQKRF